jgi:hypothetical protein
MIKAFTVSILSLFFFHLSRSHLLLRIEKVGLLKLTRDICIKRGTVPANTGRLETLPYMDSNSDPSVIQPVVSYYTD